MCNGGGVPFNTVNRLLGTANYLNHANVLISNYIRVLTFIAPFVDMYLQFSNPATVESPMTIDIMVGAQTFYFLRFFQASGSHEVR